MAWTKDLGNIKGEKGDIYVPTVINNEYTGYTTIQWTKKAYDGTVDEELQQVHIPVYVPHYDQNTGELTFELNTDGTFSDISTNVYTLKSEAIYKSAFVIKKFTGDINNVTDKDPSAFYIEDTQGEDHPKVFIYDENNDDFINLEGFAFDNFENYRLKNDSYSASEIDEMFESVATRQRIIQQLLDIEETIENNDLGD